jgi:hypothetical protein
MNIVGNQGEIKLQISDIIDRSKIRQFLEIVGNESKEYIYDETLKGNFSNGGPFTYANKKYAEEKRASGRQSGHVDFFGFSHPNTLNTMMVDVTDQRYSVKITGDAADKTLGHRGRYNWFSFGGKREAPINTLTQKIAKGFNWGG